jgi:hypothetical protein
MVPGADRPLMQIDPESFASTGGPPAIRSCKDRRAHPYCHRMTVLKARFRAAPRSGITHATPV